MLWDTKRLPGLGMFANLGEGLMWVSSSVYGEPHRSKWVLHKLNSDTVVARPRFPQPLAAFTVDLVGRARGKRAGMKTTSPIF